MNKLNNKPMNRTVKFNELPNELKLYLDAHIQNKTSHYIYESKCDWNKLKKSFIGFQCVIDEGEKEMQIFFPDKSGDYSSVKLCDFWEDINNNFQADITEWTNFNGNIDKVKEAINNIVTDKTILIDYDKKQFEDALELGDTDAINDMLSYRELTELI